MSDGRTKNAGRNMIFGGINNCVGIIFPFILRTIIIKVLGGEYLGLNSLYSSILQVISVTELGFSSAITANMYEPIAKKDVGRVSALLKLYRTIYRIIGYIVLGVGLCILPFLKHFINGKPPSGVNIYILFILYLLNTVISYMFYSYKVALLCAHQRSDLTDKVSCDNENYH